MLVLTASSFGSGVNAETQLVSDQEDTVCLIPVLCGIQDGMLKKKCPTVIRQMATPLLNYILFIFKLYSSYIKIKVNWITLQ